MCSYCTTGRRVQLAQVAVSCAVSWRLHRKQGSTELPFLDVLFLQGGQRCAPSVPAGTASTVDLCKLLGTACRACRAAAASAGLQASSSQSLSRGAMNAVVAMAVPILLSRSLGQQAPSDSLCCPHLADTCSPTETSGRAPAAHPLSGSGKQQGEAKMQQQP